MVLRDWAVDALLAAVARTFVFWGQLEGAWAWWMQLWAYGWLATFLAGCASKFEGASKFDQMLPLDSHSGTFSSPFPSIRSDGNKSQPFLRPFLNRRRRCSASDQIIITVPNKVKVIQKLSILSRMLMRSRAW